MILYFLVTLPITSGKLRFSFHFDRFLDHFFWTRPMNISLMTWKFWKLKSFFTTWKIKCHKRPLEGDDETQMRGWVNKLKTKGLNCCSDPSIMANARIIHGVDMRSAVEKSSWQNTARKHISNKPLKWFQSGENLTHHIENF